MKNRSQLIKMFKEELLLLAYLFAILIIIFKIVFYKENILVLAASVFGLFWLYILPGFTLMFIWRERFDFIERLVVGSAFGVAITGLVSYYLTLVNVPIRSQFILAPLILVVVSAVLIYVNEKK